MMDDVLATIDVRRRRFTVEEYYRMAEVGILTESERVELIEGEIIQMSPIGLRQSLCVAALINHLTRAIGDRAHIWASNPVRLVEVSDTSYRFDRHVKLPLYARASVPEVWIVDLTRDAIEVFRQPSPSGYGFTQRIERGGTVAPLAFPDVVLAATEILPAGPSQ